jgi:hypothetical protein
MYGFPEDFDGSVFVGRVLEVVSYSSNSIFLGFDNRVSITVESSFEYHPAITEGHVERQHVPVGSSNLMQLVGRSVEGVEAQRDGTLTIRFNGGHVFRCFDDQPDYESYRIAYGDDEIFV